MKISDFDLRGLLWPGVSAAAAAVVLFATWQMTDAWSSASEREYRQARSQLIQAANQYRDASDDQAVYQRYANRFTELGEIGWIGDEQRLSWIEGLQEINGEMHLPTLRYDIRQQQSASLAGTRVPDRLTLQQTPMSLQIGALHERDILDLLAALRQQGAGLMGVSECRLERAGTGPDIRVRPGQPNINANCALHWYTLQMEPE